MSRDGDCQYHKAVGGQQFGQIEGESPRMTESRRASGQTRLGSSVTKEFGSSGQIQGVRTVSGPFLTPFIFRALADARGCGRSGIMIFR